MTQQIENRHTPGPWVADSNGAVWGPQHKRSQHKNGRQLVSAAVSESSSWSPFSDNHTQDAEGKANAKLIAAAPELLEALRDIRQAYQNMFDVMPVAWQTFDHIAAAAIAKATGQQF